MPLNRMTFMNSFIDNVTMEEAVKEIERLIESGIASYVVTINVDVVIKIDEDEKLKEIVDNANLVLADGKPLVWISKWLKKPVKEKVSGSDLVPKVCEAAVQKEFRLFIIGGKEGVAKSAQRNLEKIYPGIKIVGTYSPPIGFENDDNECEKINEMIFNGRVDILLVCLGCPKQEKWVYSNYEKYNATVSICGGATVDFLAGNVKRAPKWMSDHGFEWFYRFLQEPRRLFKRYFIDDVKIFIWALKYRCKIK